jgi:coproporphyrinogen III oxidase-like Fe-S oxidoreductase
MIGDFVRKRFSKVLMGQAEVALRNRIPTHEELARRFDDIAELGIYLHIPFCRQVCPYCPYNKELYQSHVARRYADAVKKEVDSYSRIIGRRPVTSFYIGGGTPTTMLHNGLADIVAHIHNAFDVRCDIHLESHPNDLTDGNLDAIVALGVRHLSTGVESLHDRHLRFLKRPYCAEQAKEAIRRAMQRNFACVNADIIFALPGQTCREIEETGHALVEMGIDQVAAYPLFRFPYTAMRGSGIAVNYGARTVWKRRKMLRILERIFYEAGFERTSVWAFTRRGVSKYCSVTVPLYLGLGASGGSYLKDIFYLNTFNVAEYIQAIESTGTAVALSLDLDEHMQMVGWLYWRIYETRLSKLDFKRQFGHDFDAVYGKYFRFLRVLGFLQDSGERIALTDRGSYWLHAFEDLFSIEYISRLWGTAEETPWPESVRL